MRTRLARVALLAGLLVFPSCGLLELPFQLLGAVGGALVDGVGSFVGMLGQIVPSASRSLPFLVLSTEERPQVAPGTPEEELVPDWARDRDALARVLAAEPRSFTAAIAAAPASATHHYVLRVADFQDPEWRATWEQRLHGHRLLALTPVTAVPDAVAFRNP